MRRCVTGRKQLDEIVEYYEQWGMDDKLYTEVWDSTPKYHHGDNNVNNEEVERIKEGGNEEKTGKNITFRLKIDTRYLEYVARFHYMRSNYNFTF